MGHSSSYFSSARLLRYERSISTESNHVDEPHKLEEVETIRKPPPPLEKSNLYASNDIYLYWVAMVSLVHMFVKRLWIKGYQFLVSAESLLEIPVTFVVVQKRNHTRLFANKHGDHRFVDKSGNILLETVVDSKTCHSTEFDFYLCSHASIQNFDLLLDFDRGVECIVERGHVSSIGGCIKKATSSVGIAPIDNSESKGARSDEAGVSQPTMTSRTVELEFSPLSDHGRGTEVAADVYGARCTNRTGVADQCLLLRRRWIRGSVKVVDSEEQQSDATNAGG
ncbi:hypothetical protein ZIOFF_003314 [Zingiber officinale]|uniref:Piwi domain-containing protein n=1 Tax=Zingiber officinale TaxID=94328 RepID=A0A8J5MA41_ZINOF|nr:hypothetical protein ZIOFF_003314 [Zingiber officinale]